MATNDPYPSSNIGATYDQWVANGRSNGSYYDKDSNYGSSYNQTGTPIGDAYLDQNWDAANTQWGAVNGFGQTQSTRDRFFRGQVAPNLAAGFKAANAKNLNLRYSDYLKSIDAGKLMREYEMLSPDQRGEMNARFAPATRSVARG